MTKKVEIEVDNSPPVYIPLSSNATRYEEGDTVSTPQGLGVVTEVRTEPFEGKDAEVDASNNSPTYVVALKDARVGVGFYKASQLDKTDFPETDVDDPVEDIKNQSANATFDTAREGGSRTSNNWTMPDTWQKSDTPARLILLDAWQSMNGQFNCRGGGCCMGELKSEKLCASMKDAVLGGWEGWRKGE